MKLTRATTAEIPAIMEIIGHAQNYLSLLNIDQWQNGYPNENVIRNDIENHESYVVVNNENQITTTTMFSIRKEPTYTIIDGEWLTKATATYGVIHRMAMHNDYRGKGIAKFIFNSFETFLKENHIDSMRIDTHQDNKDMQQLLSRMGYEYCGIIYLENGTKRLAFEKKII